MKLLLINTCGADGVVAIAAHDTVLGVEPLPGRTASEQLLPAVRRLLEVAGWRVGDLSAVAVVHGPGSFTGARVGLATAKGLCESAAVGMLAMSRLALVADSTRSGADEVLALLDAGRAEYYFGLYSGGRCLDERLSGVEAALALGTGSRPSPDRRRQCVTCEERVVAALTNDLAGGLELVQEPGPEAILAMAMRRIANGEWSDVAMVDANYLRRTDAELLKQEITRQR